MHQLNVGDKVRVKRDFFDEDIEEHNLKGYTGVISDMVPEKGVRPEPVVEITFDDDTMRSIPEEVIFAGEDLELDLNYYYLSYGDALDILEKVEE